MADENDDIRCVKCSRIVGPCADTDCPEASPLVASEVLPALPVVAWRHLVEGHGWMHTGGNEAAGAKVIKAMGGMVTSAEALTPLASAQAAIDALTADVGRVMGRLATVEITKERAFDNYRLQKRERERLEGELENCINRIREQRAEINRLAARAALTSDGGRL